MPMAKIGGHINPRIIGSILLAGGLILNYLLERHNVFVLWENSDYPVAWADLFYPPICVLMFLAGLVRLVRGEKYRAGLSQQLRYDVTVVVPLTVLYTLFMFVMQSVQTGSDRLGECGGLDEAASSSKMIPEARWSPGHAAVACGAQRRGMFLALYNQVWIYGVTDPTAQRLVLGRITEHYREARTHPVQVMFYEGSDWSSHRQGSRIVGSSSRRRLLKVVNIG